MKADTLAAQRVARHYLRAEDCSLDAFAAHIKQTVDLDDYPFAVDVQKNVLIYDCKRIRAAVTDGDSRKAIMAEWVDALNSGPRDSTP